MSVSALYAGAVTHQRLRPKRHRLRYTLFNILVDLDELPGLAARLKLFSQNRFNLFSFFEADHGGCTPTGLRAWIETQLAAADISIEGGAIRILCMPRILGHAFNPITVFFCHRPDGSLSAIFYEVRNTFGERHVYLIPADPALENFSTISQSCSKAFYVSPFMPMQMHYRFRVTLPGAHVALAITGSDADGKLITAAFAGRRRELTDAALLRQFLRMPVLGLKVLGGIHWEAVKLFAKGLRLQPRPTPPADPITISP